MEIGLEPLDIPAIENPMEGLKGTENNGESWLKNLREGSGKPSIDTGKEMIIKCMK